jgi:hypothetical protein
VGTRTRIGRTIAQHTNHCAMENCRENELTTRHMKLQGRTRKITNGEVSTPNILARKSEGGLLPYCKIGAKSEGYNRLGPLVSEAHYSGGYLYLEFMTLGYVK